MKIPVRWLDVDGYRTRYREAGTGPAVMIVPGLGLSSRFYEPVLHNLARAGFRAVAPDLPGFGQARGPFTGSTIENAALWLLRFAEAARAGQPAWIGHSISCQIVLAVADHEPDRARALVLAGPTGGAGHPRLRQAAALARVAVTESPGIVLRVARDYLRANPVQYIGSWIRAVKDSPLERAPRIVAPTLLLIGSRDPVPPPAFVSELEQRLQRATVLHVPGGNHALPLDRTESFSGHVTDFLSKL